jgi:hypothetical protein
MATGRMCGLQTTSISRFINLLCSVIIANIAVCECVNMMYYVVFAWKVRKTTIKLPSG